LHQRCIIVILCCFIFLSAGFPALFFSSSAQAQNEILEYCIIENQGQWDSSILFFCPTSFGGIAFEKNSLVYLSIHHSPQRVSLPYATLSPKGILPSSIQYTYFTSTTEITPRTWSSILYRGIASGIDYTFYLSSRSFMCSIQGSPCTHLDDFSFYTRHSSTSLKKESQPSSSLCSVEFPMEDWLQPSDDVSARETVQAMHTNPLGISWVGGSILSPTQSSLEESSNGNHFDAYIKKYHSDGTCAETIVFGGSGWEEVTGIDVSNDGQVYCCGVTDSNDFPAMENSSKNQNASMGAFVLWYNPTNRVKKSYIIDGAGIDGAMDIKVNTMKDVYVTGYTTSTDLPITKKFVTTSHDSPQSDILVVCIDTTTWKLKYCTVIGGSYWDVGYGLCLDALQNLYITGYTFSHDFPVTLDAFDSSYNGEEDVCIVRLTPDTNHMIFGTFLGGHSFEVGKSIACDWKGNVFVAGYTSSSSFPTSPHGIQRSLSGDQDGFITKISSSGNQLHSSTYIGGSSWDEIVDLSLDIWGNVYITGNTLSDDFPITIQADQSVYRGEQDVFYMHVNPSLQCTIYSSYFGGEGYDVAGCIGIDLYQNVYISGFHSTQCKPFIVQSKPSRITDCHQRNPVFSLRQPFGAFILQDPLKINAFRTIPNNFSFVQFLKERNSLIQVNDSEPCIEYLQMILNVNPLTQLHRNPSEAGFEGKETLYFGFYTKRALQKFQILYQLESTGIVDFKTATCLDQVLQHLRRKPAKLLPSNWIVKPILRDQSLQVVSPNYEDWFMYIEDPTDGTKGWVPLSQITFNNTQQSQLLDSSRSISPTIDGQRGGSSENIIAEFITTHYDEFLPHTFPVELLLGLVVHESYPDVYNFDNSLVTFDAGRGIQQITTNSYVGSGLGMALYDSTGMRYLPYWNCYKPGLAVDYPSSHNANSEKFGGYYWVEAECLPGETFVYWGGIFQKDQCIGTCIYNCKLDSGSRIYTNTPLGIYNNIADGFTVLHDKLSATSCAEISFPIEFSSPYSEKPLILTEDDVRFVSAIQRYHGYFQYPQDDPNSYLYAISMQIKKIGLGIQKADEDPYWFSRSFSEEDAQSFLEWSEKVKYIYQENIETF
jgi:hypothetical protein